MLSKFEEAIDKLEEEVYAFGKLDEEAFVKIIEAVREKDSAKAEEARQILKGNHKANARIDMNAITTLALYAPEASDLRRVVAQIKIASELSRIGDYIRSHAKSVLQELAVQEEEEEIDSTRDAFYQSTLRALQLALESIRERDSDALDHLSRQINVEESKCDDFVAILEKNMVSRICSNPDHADEVVSQLHVIRKLERISDRCINIVKLARYALEGGKLKL